MNDLTKFFNSVLTENFKTDAIYEVIENEIIDGRNIKELDISGSLFSLTTFKNVSFESCVFFGSKIENCHFLNCIFNNCSFQFSKIENSTFKAGVFKNCKWELSPIANSTFDHTFLDTKTAYYAHKNDNQLISCSSESALSWQEALLGENSLTMPPEQASIATAPRYTVFQIFKKLAS